MNCIQLPFENRHYIDNHNLRQHKKEGFTFLDRVFNVCAKYNLYIVLDLHTALGGQNQDWYSDSGITKVLL
jgi:aryl-phospho-beta-D-glucosidase BglC (GH1 family)